MKLIKKLCYIMPLLWALVCLLACVLVTFVNGGRAW